MMTMMTIAMVIDGDADGDGVGVGGRADVETPSWGHNLSDKLGDYLGDYFHHYFFLSS